MGKVLFKKPERNHRFVMSLIILVLISLSLNGNSISKRTDSIKNMLEIEIKYANQEELRGMSNIYNLRLYTTAEKSFIVWQQKQHFYVYKIKGTNHEIRAAALFKLIQANGIVTFVANKKPSSHIRFKKCFQVIALQTMARNDD